MAQDNPLRQDFAARLKLLVTAFGLSLCALADRSRVGRSTISDWLQPGGPLPQSDEDLLSVVKACADAAAKGRRPLDAEWRNEEDWLGRLARAKQVRDSISMPGRVDGQRAEAPGAWGGVPQRPLPSADHDELPWLRDPAHVPLIRPIKELTDPFALDVHRAIDVDALKTFPELPKYIGRAHDDKLNQMVEQAAAGHSRVVVLVGESSTGKTRACWEAIHQQLLKDWQLWHPDPTRLDEEVSALDKIQPRTVIWLNDAHDYVVDPARTVRERMAEALRRLADNRGRGPVLIVGTTWPDRWALVARTPSRDQQPDDDPDPYKRVRALLAGNVIDVPAAFDDEAWVKLRDAVSDDPRLAHAYARARDKRIAQFLAGIPVLLERYRHAPAGAKALIHAAMDARNLGHGRLLPLDLLEAAAHGYLTDDEWDMLPDTWLADALAYAGDSRHGIRGALTPVRPRPGESDANRDRYRLADYLDQTGRTTRRISEVPASLWDALGRHAAAPDLTSLADQAQKRGFLQKAIDMYSAAAERGDLPGLLSLTWLLKAAGRIDEALRTCWRSVEVNGEGWETLAGLLEQTGDREEAITAYRKAAESGSIYALNQLARLSRDGNRVDEAIIWFQGYLDNHGDAHGKTVAATITAELLEQVSRTDDAISLYARGAEVRYGGYHSLSAGAKALERAGRADQLIGYYKRAGEAENEDAIKEATRLLEQAGKAEEAISWLQSLPSNIGFRAAGMEAARLLRKTRGIDAALRWLGECHDPWEATELLQHEGKAEEALAWFQTYAAETGWTDQELMGYCPERAGRTEEALRVYQGAADRGSGFALHQGALIVEAAGHIDNAVAWLTARAAARTYPALAWKQAAEVLGRANRVDEALDYYQRACEAGDDYAFTLAAELLADKTGLDFALIWLRARADEGQAGALDAACSVLRKAGRYEDAERLRRFGWE